MRANVWRIGRRLYFWARREVPNDPNTNGEYWLLTEVVNANSTPSPLYLDIGAFRGDWSDRAQTLLRNAGIGGRVHAYEPSAAAYEHLAERFKSSEWVSTSKVALSDQSGAREFFVVSEVAGINSLSLVLGARVEQVESARLDDLMETRKINHVVLAKCDAEGHDLNVLRGAVELFRQGHVDIWQFEYNHRWLTERAQLKDVFDFIADKPYRLGKLYGDGIEIYECWHPELERFIESNYVLIRQGSGFERLCSYVCFDHRNVLVPVEP